MWLHLYETANYVLVCDLYVFLRFLSTVTLRGGVVAARYAQPVIIPEGFL